MRKFLASLILLLFPLAVEAGSWDHRPLEPGGTSTFSWTPSDSGAQQALHLSKCSSIAYSAQTYDASGENIELYLLPAELDDPAIYGVLIGTVVQTQMQLSTVIQTGPYYLRPVVVANGGAEGTISVRCMSSSGDARLGTSSLAVLPAISSDAAFRAAADSSPIISLGLNFPGYLWIGQDGEGDYLPFGATSSSVATTGTCAAIPASCASEGALYVANDVSTVLTTGCTGGGSRHVLFQCDTNGAATDTWHRVWRSPHLWQQVHSGTVGTFTHTLEEADIHRFGWAIRQQLTGNNACLQSTYKGGLSKQPLVTGDSVSYIPMGGMLGKVDVLERDLVDVDYLVGLIQRGNGATVVLDPNAGSAAAALNVANIGEGLGVMTYRGDWYGWVVRGGVATVVQFPCTGNYETSACMGTDQFVGWFEGWNVLIRWNSPKPSQDPAVENQVDFAFKSGPPGYYLEPIQADNVGAQNPWMFAGTIFTVPGVVTFTPVVTLCQHTGGDEDVFARLERMGFMHNLHDRQ